MLYDDDDEEFYLNSLPGVVPYRGRLLEPESQAPVGFTLAELDALAPLPDSERESIKSNDPTLRAVELLRLRIRAARILKYGDTDAEEAT